jgi:muramoyltetrapeptide carboxypeptidase
MKLSKGWTPLKEGDLVEIIAPGSSCKPEGLNGGLKFLEGWGLTPKLPHKIFAPDVICSNTDENRFDHLREALLSDDSSAIWCVRGGYGSNRLVPELAKLKKPKGPPKLFIGYSDITTLHTFLNEQWGWPTIHGPMIDRIGRGLVLPKELEELRAVFFGEKKEVTFKGLKPLNAAAKAGGAVKGPVTGGNLVTLQSAIGTKAPWNTKGKIVFLEEIDERGYRVDRLLEHLKQTGHFAKARAVVLGEFVGGAESDGTNRIPAVLKRFAESLSIPVMTEVEAGHGEMQRPVPFATSATLTLGSRGTLTINSGAWKART